MSPMQMFRFLMLCLSGFNLGTALRFHNNGAAALATLTVVIWAALMVADSHLQKKEKKNVGQ